MRLQSSTLSKEYSTRFTFERFLSSMSAQVNFQISILRKAHSTCFTFECFLPSMSAQMSLQVSASCKAFATRDTFEGFMPTTGAHNVHLLYMTSQSTCVTFERFLSSMSVRMSLHTYNTLKPEFTCVTLEGILPGMISVSSDTYFVKTVIHTNHISGVFPWHECT